MDKVKTAVVGVGHLGQHHARWYKSIEGSDLVGIYDIDRDKCRKLAGDLNVRAFDDLDSLAGSVEAASVSVPTVNHHEAASFLLRRGIHCLVEKPIAADTAQAEDLMKIARGSGATLTVGHIERFNPAVGALKNYEIRPRFIEAHRLAAFDPRGTDVAVILDLMIHDIELALHLIGSEVAHTEASAVAVISETADIANARLTFKNGAVANLTASRISLRAMRKLRIFQKSGYFSLDLAEKRADIYRLADSGGRNHAGMRIPLGKSGHEIVYSKAGDKDEDMLRAELVSFLDAVKNGTPPEVSADDGLRALRVALDIERLGLGGAAED
jgi:predicted dehydrogenase